MRLEKIEMAVKVIVPDPDTHSSLLHTIIAQRDTSRYAFFAECSVVIVHKQQAWG